MAGGRSSPASSGFPFPSNKSRKKNSRRSRGRRRTHLGGLLEPREGEDVGSRRRLSARFQSFALRAARVPRVQQMVKGGCGVEGEHFIALGLRKEEGNPEKFGIERGCDGVRLGFDSRKKNRALTGGTGSSAAERREREGVRARAGLAAWWAALTGQGRRGRAAPACWAGEGELGRARPKREGKGGEGFGWGFSFFFLSFSIPFSKEALKQTNQNKNRTYNTK